MEVKEIINLAIGVSGLSISGMGLWMSIRSTYMEWRTRHFYIRIFAILSIYVFFNLLGQITNSYHTPAWAAFARFTLFCESLFSSVLTTMVTAFLLYRSGEDWRRSPDFRISAVLWGVYVVLLTSTWFSGAIYFIDDGNVYHRGPYYPALLVPVILVMALNLIVLISRRDRLSHKERVAFAVYAAIPMICMLIQMTLYGVYLIVFGSSLAAMFMFIYIQSDQTERYAMQESENAQLRMDIMLSQIQPHFLYNTLGSISHLCRDNPEAKAAINRFSRYLQGNMSSLSKTEPIPFKEELEHTKAYLDLEKLRFGDDLTVRYDLEATEFLIPVLTLQPLVENAVFHGVRGREDGKGTLTVSSRELSDRYEITVEDDGPGFDPEAVPDDGDAHIGLQNVRARLQRWKGADLIVDSAPGEGCRVTIVMPKEIEHADLRH